MTVAWLLVVVGAPTLVLYTIGALARARQGAMKKCIYGVCLTVIGLMPSAVISSALLVSIIIESMLPFIFLVVVAWGTMMLVRHRFAKPSA